MCKCSGKAKKTKSKWLSNMAEALQRYADSYNRAIYEYEKGRKKRKSMTVSFGGYDFSL